MSTDSASVPTEAQVKGPAARIFNGKKEAFKLWLMRSMAYLRNTYPKQLEVAEGAEDLDKSTADYKKHNSLLFETLIQILDDHSADLIVEQTPYDGAAAIELLKREYIGSEANNAIASIMELIELTHKEAEGETLTEYGNRMIKLKKIISNYDFDLDKLVTVCGIRGLSDTFDLFKQVIKRGVWPTAEKLNLKSQINR